MAACTSFFSHILHQTHHLIILGLNIGVTQAIKPTNRFTQSVLLHNELLANVENAIMCRYAQQAPTLCESGTQMCWSSQICIVCFQAIQRSMYCSRRYLLEVVQSGNIPVAYVRWMGIRTAVHASVFNYCNRVMHGMPVRPFSQACEASLGSTLSLSPARTSIKVVRIQHDGCHKICKCGFARIDDHA